MKKKISQGLKSRFVVIWIALLVVIVGLVAVRYLFNQTPPTLVEVLSQDHVKKSGFSWDLSLIFASLAAFSLAALSLAKGYEMVSRKKPVEAVCPSGVEVGVLEKDIEGKNQEIEKLAKCNGDLQECKGELETRLKIVNCEVEELKRIEQMLRKSNISLGKECERLKSDNEELMLRANAIKIRAQSAPQKTIKSRVKVLKKTGKKRKK